MIHRANSRVTPAVRTRLAQRLLSTRLPSRVAEMRLQDAARLAGVPYQTFVRYVRLWHQRGVPGVTTRTGRARAGRVYVVEPSVVDRYHRCELSPR
jgi:hypothetical protein